MSAAVFMATVLIAPFPPLMADHFSTPPSEHAPVEFSRFIRSLKTAKYASYAGQPGTQAATEADFIKMRQYLLEHYRGVKAARSFVDGDGAVVDCVLTNTQPSLQNPSAAAASPPPDLPSPQPGGTQTDNLTTDKGGEKTPCPANTIPLRRITLDELLRSGTLQHFLQKSPGEHLPGR